MQVRKYLRKGIEYALIAILFGAGSVFAATTISTNIQTDGTLSVTGTSTLTGLTTMGYASTTGITVTTAASTTNLVVSSAGGTAGCATFSSIGLISNTGVACGSGGSSFAYPFSVTTNYATTSAATTTPLWAKLGIFASSTSQFVNATFTIATTTNLIVSSASAGCAQFNAAGLLTSTGSNCNINTSNFTYLINFATTTAATTTQLWLQNGILASSTSQFVNATFTIATTTNLIVSSASAGCAQFSATGVLSSVGISCGTNSPTTDFTYTSGNYARLSAATSTPLWAQGGLSASSTVFAPSINIGNNEPTVNGISFGYCTIPNTTIAASSTASSISCTTNASVSTSDRIIVQATSSLPTNFLIQSATVANASTILLSIYNVGSTTAPSGTATGINSFNFWAAH